MFLEYIYRKTAPLKVNIAMKFNIIFLYRCRVKNIFHNDLSLMIFFFEKFYVHLIDYTQNRTRPVRNYYTTLNKKSFRYIQMGIELRIFFLTRNTLIPSCFPARKIKIDPKTGDMIFFLKNDFFIVFSNRIEFFFIRSCVFFCYFDLNFQSEWLYRLRIVG